jgi:dephospho-CoA kinase
MLVVGLTGGIGCGKSTVSRRFSELGVPVIDADDIARKLVEPGSPALDEIAERLGAEYIDASGRLNRSALRERIFDDPEARATLEHILHPRVRAEIQTRAAKIDATYCLVAVPLLIESGMQDLVDRVLVVDCDPDQQVARVAARDTVPAEQIRAILAAQLPREQRLAAADDVIDNSGTPEALFLRIEDLDAQYRRIGTTPDA